MACRGEKLVRGREGGRVGKELESGLLAGGNSGRGHGLQA